MADNRPRVYVYKAVEALEGDVTPGGYFGLVYRDTKAHICYFVISETVDGIPTEMGRDHCWALPEKDFQEIIGGDFNHTVEVFVGTPVTRLYPQA